MAAEPPDLHLVSGNVSISTQKVSVRIETRKDGWNTIEIPYIYYFPPKGTIEVFVNDKKVITGSFNQIGGNTTNRQETIQWKPGDNITIAVKNEDSGRERRFNLTKHYSLLQLQQGDGTANDEMTVHVDIALPELTPQKLPIVYPPSNDNM